MTPSPTDFKILPSILSADFGKIADEAQTVDIPEIDYLHVDIMDGHYVPNITVGPRVVEALREHTRFKLDVHLMIEKVTEFIPRFAEAGAHIITIHPEAVTHLHRQLYLIKDSGLKAGVSINPATPLQNIRWILNDIDLVLIMSVNPGFGGQKFIKSSLDKIRELFLLRESLKANFVIEVDGGINAKNIGSAYFYGARYFVAGNAIFGNKNRPAAIREMINTINSTRLRQTSKLV